MQEASGNTLWTCVCQKYGFGQPHEVSKATWYRHLRQASDEEEKQQIYAAQDPSGVRRQASQALHAHPQDMQPGSSGNARIRTRSPDDSNSQFPVKKHARQSTPEELLVRHIIISGII